MKSPLYRNQILLGTFLVLIFFSFQNAFGQVCINNPSIQQGTISSTTGSGSANFSFFENLLDYTDEENDPILLDICLFGMNPPNGVGSISGSFSPVFTWTYDPVMNCFQGTQNQDILGGTGGLISVAYDVVQNGPCVPLELGFIATLTPAACMNGINETIDDIESVVNNIYGSGLQITDADCFGQNGAAAYLFGTGSFDLLWSTGETIQQITGLGGGNYGLTVTDLNTSCVYPYTFSISTAPTCEGFINGSVMIDHVTPDCTIDGTSYPSVNRTVSLYQNNQLIDVATTDQLGNYSFSLDTGTFVVQLMPGPFDIFNCSMTHQQTVNVATPTIFTADFIYDVTPNQNLCVFHDAGVARPGFNQNHSIEYCNVGTIPITTGYVEFTHDLLTHTLISHTGSNPPTPTTYDPTTGVATWDFTNLQPGECRRVTFRVTISQPPIVNIDDTLHFQSVLYPHINDVDSENNFMDTEVITVGSYDPNDKQNLVGESSWGGPVEPADDQFKYYIRFQNTGTDTAFNVVIKDEIHPNLDISTVRPISSSHSYSLSTENTNTLVFSFNNILLVDSTTNEPASNGYVCFAIDLLPNLPLGTVIENEAAIYFDFNLPVITNIVTNTITDLQTSITDWQSFDGEVAVYPNPTLGIANLEIVLDNPNTLTIELLSVNGQQLDRLALNQKFEKGKHLLPLGTSELTPGLYLIRVTGKQGAKTLKLVKF